MGSLLLNEKIVKQAAEMLNDGVNAYAYDSTNRLNSVSRDREVVSNYGYNGLGK